MKKIVFALIVLLGFVSCGNEGKINTLTKKEKEAGWELLFDGKTTDGWRIFQGGEVTGWNITDGILCNSGVGSDHGGIS